MKYKLQAMSNLEKTKERKFTSGMNRRYRLIFSNPVSGMKKDDWVKIHPHFTPNFPANLQEEAEIAKNLEAWSARKHSSACCQSWIMCRMKSRKSMQTRIR